MVMSLRQGQPGPNRSQSIPVMTAVQQEGLSCGEAWPSVQDCAGDARNTAA